MILVLLLLVGCAPEPSEKAWFTEVSLESGTATTHESGASGQFWLPEIMGPGVVLFDYDDDGDLDCYLPNGNRLLPAVGVADDLRNRLLEQTDDGSFRDVTEASGLGDGGYGMGAAVGDMDNDGLLDIYVTNFGPDRLYRNRGDGTFERVPGVGVDHWSCSAAFLDYDRDGDLDLYVTRYVEFDPNKSCTDEAGERDYCGPRAFQPMADVLLRNDGDGAFHDVSEAAGITAPPSAGLGVVVDDFNDDGWIDIYVANDAYANHLYLNRQDGSFDEVALMYGAAYNLHGRPEAGMGVASVDLDGDLHNDLFLTHLDGESNTLYRQLGPGRGFSDSTGQARLAASSRALTGFGVAAFDVELDGDIDLFVVNGRVVLGDPAAGTKPDSPWGRLAQPNLLYLNDGSGRFRLATSECGALCARTEVTRGTAVGDVDGDGDLDIVLSNTQGPARLYLNDAPRQGNWLIVRAIDPALNRDAIGARVYVHSGGRIRLRTVSPAVGYLSASDTVAHFGLGPDTVVDAIEVHWPDGSRERFAGGPGNRAVAVERGAGEPL